MNFHSSFILIILLVFGVAACTNKTNNAQLGKQVVYMCDVEQIAEDGKRFLEKNGSDILFSNTNTRSDEAALSGTYSSKLYPGNRFGMTTELNDVKPDDYLEITVWRKSPAESGLIVADGGEVGGYEASGNVVEKGKDGWEKIELEYYVPPNYFSGKVKIYAWNNTADTIYFDDLQIIHRNKKEYASFESYPKLRLYVDEQFFQAFGNKRFDAFETGVLVNSGDDFVPMMLYDGHNFLNGELRLKGDLIDHLYGDKWSYRLKFKKGFAWNGMLTFSVQNPSTRHFLNEWFAHKIYLHEDVLTTRYGFIPIEINSESRGVYAWEEHFEKQLVENKNRREGPIIRFDETLFWDQIRETRLSGQNWDVDYYGAAQIIPFRIGGLIKDSLKVKQFEEAETLLTQFKFSSAQVTDVFDVKKLAAYYALLDLTQAYHGFAWHNLRFYYNPVTCLLEPIAFDGYIEDGIYKRIDERINGLFPADKVDQLSRMDLMLYKPFENPVFCEEYLTCLKKYSAKEFVAGIIAGNKSEIDSLTTLLQVEFPYYNADFSYIQEQAAFINNNLENIRKNLIELGAKLQSKKIERYHPGTLQGANANLIVQQVHAYFDKSEKKLSVFNHANTDVKILGAFMKMSLPLSFDDKPVIEPSKGIVAKSLDFKIKEGVPEKLLFAVGTEMFEAMISQWAAPKEKSARQVLQAQPLHPDLTFSGDSVLFEGNYNFSEDVVIPDSFKVYIKAGTTIDFTHGAGFFCFAPVVSMGNASQPVYIHSSDSSANGFNILQAAGKSRFSYTYFSRLSNMNHSGWFSPAAVNIYESDVELEYCRFERNKNCDDALNVVRSDFRVNNCEFKHTFADAFDSDFCTGTVRNCTFENIGNDAIDFSGSQVAINDCQMFEIGDKAISGGEKSELNVSDVKIENANIGIASKDLSRLTLDRIEIDGVKYGLVAFVKKPEYGPASIKIDNLKLKNKVVFHQIELGSVLELNDRKIEGREENLAVKLYQ
ncbi:CotH kinase family protein [Maribellus sediminis]|uniref:CotH kinase family protein n=1 Tax=Maribellus sediminis TaxID=2696285 RepID=UPI001432050D|nr:right-handed parallel beta-helix repeat-containing protein [Maribellus sediminis]